MLQLQTFDWPAMNDDDEAVAVAVALPHTGRRGVWLGNWTQCLCLSDTLCCAVLCYHGHKMPVVGKVAKLVSFAVWKYNCGYDGGEGGSVRVFYCPFCLEFYYWKCFDGSAVYLMLACHFFFFQFLKASRFTRRNQWVKGSLLQNAKRTELLIMQMPQAFVTRECYDRQCLRPLQPPCP